MNGLSVDFTDMNMDLAVHRPLRIDLPKEVLKADVLQPAPVTRSTMVIAVPTYSANETRSPDTQLN